MAYKVGSLADLISGTRDANTINRSVVFVPALKKTASSVLVGQETSGLEQSKKRGKKRKFTALHSNEESVFEENDPSLSINLTRSKPAFDIEKESRTVFVKNIPNIVKERDVKKMFEKYGNVECLRFRCAPPRDPKMPKKAAVIKKDYHPDRSNICAFVRFSDLESVENALKANGSLMGSHRIFVDKAINSEKRDQKKAIFVGNLPLSAEEDDVWNVFEKCGEIVDIRVVRDKLTGIGKGFAFVNFKNADAVELAVALQDVKLKEKQLRIFRAFNTPCQEKDRRKGNKKAKNKGDPNNRLTNRENNNSRVRKDNIRIAKKEVYGKKVRTNLAVGKVEKKRIQESNHEFQGQKGSHKKKKKKISKAELKKKIIAKKLMSVSGKKKGNSKN